MVGTGVRPRPGDCFRAIAERSQCSIRNIWQKSFRRTLPATECPSTVSRNSTFLSSKICWAWEMSAPGVSEATGLLITSPAGPGCVGDSCCPFQPVAPCPTQPCSAQAAPPLTAVEPLPAPPAVARLLRRNVLLEAGIAVVVLAVTALLVSTPPAKDSYFPSADRRLFRRKEKRFDAYSTTVRRPRRRHPTDARPASRTGRAHVDVSAPDATAGGYAKLTFRLAAEKDVATTEVEIVMPIDTPIASVLVQPHAGWTYRVTTAAPAKPLSDGDGPVTQIVSRIVFTATADGIKPGEFDEFDVSAGRLPETEQVVFKGSADLR